MESSSAPTQFTDNAARERKDDVSENVANKSISDAAPSDKFSSASVEGARSTIQSRETPHRKVPDSNKPISNGKTDGASVDRDKIALSSERANQERILNSISSERDHATSLDSVSVKDKALVKKEKSEASHGAVSVPKRPTDQAPDSTIDVPNARPVDGNIESTRALTTGKTIVITATLPPGCKPGDTMMAPYGIGQITSFVVPKGSQAGDTLELTVPAPPPVSIAAAAAAAAAANASQNRLRQQHHGGPGPENVSTMGAPTTGRGMPSNLDAAGWAQLYAHLAQVGLMPPMYRVPPFGQNGNGPVDSRRRAFPHGFAAGWGRGVGGMPPHLGAPGAGHAMWPPMSPGFGMPHYVPYQNKRSRGGVNSGSPEHVIRNLLHSMTKHVQQRIRKERRQAITAKDRKARAIRSTIMSAFRRELAYRRKRCRTHTALRPSNCVWPPRLADGSIVPLPLTEIPENLAAEPSALLFLQWKDVSEENRRLQSWERKFWATLVKSKIPKQPKLHGVLWCESLLYQAQQLGIGERHSLCVELRRNHKIATENLTKGKRQQIKRLNVRFRLGNSVCLPKQPLIPAVGPPGRLLGLHRVKKRSYNKGNRGEADGRSSVKRKRSENSLSSTPSCLSLILKECHGKLWMSDWKHWITYKTTKSGETLESVSSIINFPSLPTLLRHNRKRYPSITPTQILPVGSEILVRPNVDSVRSSRSLKWRGSSWTPRVGVKIDARWNGGKEASYPGYYPATVTGVHTSAKRRKILEIRYYDGSVDTSVSLSNVRMRCTAFGVTWPHKQRKRKSDPLTFGLKYSVLERAYEKRRRFNDISNHVDSDVVACIGGDRTFHREMPNAIPALFHLRKSLSVEFVTVTLPKKKRNISKTTASKAGGQANHPIPKSAMQCNSTASAEVWIPKVDSIVEARWKGGSDKNISGWYSAVVRSLSVSKTSRGPSEEPVVTLSLRYEDGSIDSAVQLHDVRKKLDKSVLGRRTRREFTGFGTRFGIVVDADLLRSIYIIRYDDGDEEDVLGEELRALLCSDATPERVSELMACNGLGVARVVKECKIEDTEHLRRWLRGEPRDESTDAVEKAIGMWYERVGSTSIRATRRSARTFAPATFKKSSFGRAWRDYDGVDYEEFAPTYEGLARSLEHVPFRAKLRLRRMSSTLHLARDAIVKRVLSKMKTLGMSRAKLASVCRLRGVRALHWWLERQSLHFRTVQEAGLAAMRWVNNPRYPFDDLSNQWEHQHRACTICGQMINSVHRSAWCMLSCVDCALVQSTYRADVARVRSLMKTKKLKTKQLAREIGGSARPLDLWMSGAELEASRVRKAGNEALLWFVNTVLSTGNDALIESNQRADAARAAYLFDTMKIVGAKLRAEACGIDDKDREDFVKWLDGRPIASSSKPAEFHDQVQRWFDDVIYPPKRRWTLAKGTAFGITSATVATRMRERGLSSTDLAAKLGLPNAMGLDLWLRGRELHFACVEEAKRVAVKWCTDIEEMHRRKNITSNAQHDFAGKSLHKTTCGNIKKHSASKKDEICAEGDWIAYITVAEDETLESVARLEGTPSLDVLVRRNRLHHPNIKRNSLLKKGTMVLIRAQNTKSSSAKHNQRNDVPKRRKQKPWKARVGDQVEARWNSGKESNFSGWYVAHIVKIHSRSKNNDPRTLSLRYYDGSVDDSVNISYVRKRTVGTMPMAFVKSTSASISKRKDPRIGPQYQITKLPVPSSRADKKTAADDGTAASSSTTDWPHEVATCDASYVGNWNGEWESCRVISTNGDNCRIVCKADSKEFDVPQKFVRRKDVTISLYGGLQLENEFCYEVATCDNDYVGEWTGKWEPCRRVTASGDTCRIVCKYDGKKIDGVPQRFVRLSVASKHALRKRRPTIWAPGKMSHPLLHDTAKKLSDQRMWFTHKNSPSTTRLWTRKEKDLFNKAIIARGPNFRRLAKDIGTKNVHDCISYYYREFKYKSEAYTKFKDAENELEAGALPPGWKVVVRHRGALGGAKGTYKIYVAPDKKKFRSLAAVNRYFLDRNMPGCDIARIKSALGEGKTSGRRAWVPALGEIVEAQHAVNGHSRYSVACVTAVLPREQNGGQQILSLRFLDDGSVNPVVPLSSIRRRLDEDVIGRFVRKKAGEGKFLFGKVYDADVQNDVFGVRYDDGTIVDLTSRQLRKVLSRSGPNARSKTGTSSSFDRTNAHASKDTRSDRYQVRGHEIAPDNLPNGWRTVEVVRRSGKTAGTRDRYFISPEGRRFRSLKELERFVSGDTVVDSASSSPRKADDAGDSISAAPGRGSNRATEHRRRPIEGKEERPANLPDGWKAVVRQRGALGGSKGTYTYYVSPKGKKFRSLAAVRRFLSNGQVSSPLKRSKSADLSGGRSSKSKSRAGSKKKSESKRKGKSRRARSSTMRRAVSSPSRVAHPSHSPQEHGAETEEERAARLVERGS